MKRRGVLPLLAVGVLAAGCDKGALPSGPPEPARAPRPPVDEVDAALQRGDLLGESLLAWRADVDGETGPVWPTAADVRPSPHPVRAKWSRGAGGRHRRIEPDESPTVPLYLFTHPRLLAGTETIPGGIL